MKKRVTEIVQRSADPHQVGILGAGTMGRGIAQVAITHAWGAVLYDADYAVALEAADSIAARLQSSAAKGRITTAERDEALARLRIARRPDEIAGCGLIIEAITEDLGSKSKALAPFADTPAVLASNTSSLSILDIGKAVGSPGRVIGMHFFNPAPVQPLVEIVSASRGSRADVDCAAEVVRSWGKTVAHCSDSPGFIVNRVARPYYLEPWRLLEEGVAGVARIDSAMRRLGGFRMGPFELLDFIGHDLSAAVSRRVWDRLARPGRLTPPPLQQTLIERGDLGRKTGRGAYRYSENNDPEPILLPERPRTPPSAATAEAVHLFANSAADIQGEEFTDQYIFARILGAYFLEGALALQEGVADENNIDTAMRLGPRFPLGPHEWAGRAGGDVCRRLFECLSREPGGDRFAASGLLFDH